MSERLAGDVEKLSGWGRTAPTTATIHDVAGADVPGLVRDLAGRGPDARGLIARGLGRSYGDPAQNAGGEVVGRIAGETVLDREAPGGPTARVAAGTSLHDLMRALIPTGHFVPVTPGTRYVTVGGAIAADVHGKNHHRVGSFGNHVVTMDLVGGDGVVRTIGPEQDPDLFWATVGGMGLTGVILGAVIRVAAVDSGFMSVRTERIDDLDALMTRMREADHAATHSVAWIDTLARGRRLGRSVLTLGEHARADELTGAARSNRWATPGGPLVAAPSYVPPHLVSRPTIRAFNELWFRKAPRIRVGEIQSISAFFHPLDLVTGWNRLYGRSGLVQYQFVIPDSAESDLPMILERIAAAGHPSFLSVLKRFGPGNAGLLSFPQEGWTLAVDMPGDPGLRSLLTELDVLVVERGGRVYLAKDSRMSSGSFQQMYPRLEDFRRVKARIDPERVFQSDLSRRLQI